MKVCSKCGIEKLLDEFYSDKQKKDGRQSNCKACNSEYSRKYRQLNADKIKEYIKHWKKENSDKVKEYQVKKYKKDRKKINERSRQWYKKNSEKAKKQMKKWAKENSDKKSCSKIHRRTRKRSLPAYYTAKHWQAALQYFNHCCAVCGRQFNNLLGDFTAAMDHWIPLSAKDCPGTTPDNIIPLCHGVGGCNNSKSSKDAQKWLVETYGKKKAKEILTRIEEYFSIVRGINNDLQNH